MPGWSKLSETLSMTRVTPPPGAGYSWTMSLMTTDAVWLPPPRIPAGLAATFTAASPRDTGGA
jgi:hypothetical protein